MSSKWNKGKARCLVDNGDKRSQETLGEDYGYLDPFQNMVNPTGTPKSGRRRVGASALPNPFFQDSSSISVSEKRPELLIRTSLPIPGSIYDFDSEDSPPDSPTKQSAPVLKGTSAVRSKQAPTSISSQRLYPRLSTDFGIPVASGSALTASHPQTHSPDPSPHRGGYSLYGPFQWLSDRVAKFTSSSPSPSSSTNGSSDQEDVHSGILPPSPYETSGAGRSKESWNRTASSASRLYHTPVKPRPADDAHVTQLATPASGAKKNHPRAEQLEPVRRQHASSSTRAPKSVIPIGAEMMLKTPPTTPQVGEVKRSAVRQSAPAPTTRRTTNLGRDPIPSGSTLTPRSISKRPFALGAAPLSPAQTPNVSRTAPATLSTTHPSQAYAGPFDPALWKEMKSRKFCEKWTEDYSIDQESSESDRRKLFGLGLPNGQVLTDYQTADTAAILHGMCSRSIGSKEEVESGTQGAILNYEMGLGKTHVGVVLIFLHYLFVLKVLGGSTPLRPYLIIAPKAVHHQWVELIVSITAGAMKASIYSGGRTPLDRNAHIIITTIETFRNHFKRFSEVYLDVVQEAEKLASQPVSRSHPRTTKQAETSRIMKVMTKGALTQDAPMAITHWACIVVDECHVLSNPTKISAISLLAATSDNFLLLSGTVAQNKLDDWQVPWALVLIHKSRRKDAFAVENHARSLAPKPKRGERKMTDIKIKFSEILDKFNEAVITHLFPQTVFTRCVVNPVTNKKLIKLPRIWKFYCRVDLRLFEQYFHDVMGELVLWPIVRLLRQRQACINPAIALKGLAKSNVRDAGGSAVTEAAAYAALKKDFDDLGDCMDIDSDKEDVKLSCLPSAKSIHKSIRNGIKLQTKNPLKSSDEEDEEDSELAQEIRNLASQVGIENVLEDEYISGKFAAVLRLVKMVPKGDKTIVFSIFTLVLDELAKLLRNNGIEVVRYDGRMNSDEKEDALKTIRNDDSKRVILVSMKAGGVGLNITACNHVIIMDPWWNPYVEEQAIARAYRMGQTKEVHVYHIVCPRTIEDRINVIQVKKRAEIDPLTRRLATMRHKKDEERMAQGLPWSRPL